MLDAAVLALALVLDTVFSEPPNRFHPVAWLGKLIALQERLAPRSGGKAQLVYGIAIVLADVAAFSLPVYWLLGYLGGVSPIVYLIVGAITLKMAFSVRFLAKSASEIRGLLEAGRLPEARFNLRSLVSRDTSGLDRPHLVSATVESVAESTCDSFVAPFFYFLVLGVPGAIGYRVVNTLDAMIGYHGEYEYLGKFAARLDDVLNYIPARVTAFLIVAVAFLFGRGRYAGRILRRDHGRTESPNAGWPMSAMAGALGVRLEKIGFYRLGDEQNQLAPETIGVSIRFMYLTVSLWSLICVGVGLARYAYLS